MVRWWGVCLPVGLIPGPHGSTCHQATKTFLKRLVLGGCKMSISPHLPTRILKAYIAALTGFSLVQGPSGLNNTLLSQVWGIHSMDGRWGVRSLWLPRSSLWLPPGPWGGHMLSITSFNTSARLEDQDGTLFSISLLMLFIMYLNNDVFNTWRYNFVCDTFLLV